MRTLPTEVALQMWTLVLGYVSSSTRPQDRSAMISGFAVQVAALGLLGKGLYPA